MRIVIFVLVNGLSFSHPGFERVSFSVPVTLWTAGVLVYVIVGSLLKWSMNWANNGDWGGGVVVFSLAIIVKITMYFLGFLKKCNLALLALLFLITLETNSTSKMSGWVYLKFAVLWAYNR